VPPAAIRERTFELVVRKYEMTLVSSSWSLNLLLRLFSVARPAPPRQHCAMDEDDSAEVASPSRWTASKVYPDMWVDPGDDPRDSEAELHDERERWLPSFAITASHSK
jgi:hypothetical protein